MDGLLKMRTGDLILTGGSNPYLIWMGEDSQAAPFSGGLTEDILHSITGVPRGSQSRVLDCLLSIWAFLS